MEQFLTGLGLSGSAGLNAYLPLLIIGVMHRLNLMEVAEPYNMLSSPPILALLVILLIIEMTADKIPAVDHMNDMIQTAIRPAAGALLFVSSTSAVESTDPTLLTAASLLTGSISAGSIHMIKATARPAVAFTTFGFGNAIVSLFEDIISFTVSVFAILLPFVVIFFALSVFTLAWWLIWDIRRTRRYFPRSAEWQLSKRWGWRQKAQNL
jgi:hypothetical protein